MNFVFASHLESVNDVDSLALKETARPQTVPQTRFGGRIYSETGHFSRKVQLSDAVKVHNRL